MKRKMGFLMFSSMLGLSLLVSVSSCKKDTTDDVVTPPATPTTLNEDFESGAMPANFTLINDNNTVYTSIAALFPTAWAVRPEPADTTNMTAGSPSWFAAVAPADRWMITNSIVVGANYTLKWRAKAQDPAYRDGYAVKISTTGKAKADFTTTAFTVAAEDSSWVNHSYNLSSLSGKTIYVAFVQNSTDMFYIMVDDIKVGVNTAKQEKPVLSNDGINSIIDSKSLRMRK